MTFVLGSNKKVRGSKCGGFCSTDLWRWVGVSSADVQCSRKSGGNRGRKFARERAKIMSCSMFKEAKGMMDVGIDCGVITMGGEVVPGNMNVVPSFAALAISTRQSSSAKARLRRKVSDSPNQF